MMLKVPFLGFANVLFFLSEMYCFEFQLLSIMKFWNQETDPLDADELFLSRDSNLFIFMILISGAWIMPCATACQQSDSFCWKDSVLFLQTFSLIQFLQVLRGTPSLYSYFRQSLHQQQIKMKMMEQGSPRVGARMGTKFLLVFDESSDSSPCVCF